MRKSKFSSSYTFPISFCVPPAEIPLAKASQMPEAKVKEWVLWLQSKSHSGGKKRLTSWILIQRPSCYCWLSNLDRFLKKQRGIWNITVLPVFTLLPWVRVQLCFCLDFAVWRGLVNALFPRLHWASEVSESFGCKWSKWITPATTTTRRDLLVKGLD